MERSKQLLDDYRLADEEQRLAMFLTYRDLRDEFQEIDETGPELSATKGLAVGPLIKKWMVSCWDFRLVVQLERERHQNPG